MFRIKLLRAFLYPLLLPRRYLSALAMMAVPQAFAVLLAALAGGLMVGLNLLPTHKTRWLIAQETVTDLLYRGCCGLFVAAAVVAVTGSLMWLGYWLRVTGQVAQGNPDLPPTTGRLRMLLDGLGGLLIALLFLVPVTCLDVVCLRSVTLSGHSGLQLMLRLLGSGLATTVAALLTMAAGMLAKLSLMRLATRGPRSALNPLGILRDFRRGWADYLLIWLLLLVPGTLLAVLVSLTASIVLIPFVLLVVQPLACYVSLLSAALLGRYHQAYLHSADSARCTLPGICVLPAAVVALLCAAGLSFSLISTRLLWERAPEAVRVVRSELAPPQQAPANSPYSALDAYARAAPPEVEKDVASLAAYLTKDAKSDREKARALTVWIVDRLEYDQAARRAGVPPDPSPEYTLRTRRAVCLGYATLFQALATKAGMNAEVVLGYAKTDPEADEFKEDSYHAWNAVVVDGKWALLDPTWADQREFAESYFLAAPEQLIFTHFPDEPRCQRLTRPLTKDEFLDQPLVIAEFFKPGAELKAPYRRELSSGQPEHFEIKLPGADEVVIHMGEKRVPLQRTGDLFQGDVAMQAGEATIYAHFDGSRYYEGMIRYNVR